MDGRNSRSSFRLLTFTLDYLILATVSPPQPQKSPSEARTSGEPSELGGLVCASPLLRMSDSLARKSCQTRPDKDRKGKERKRTKALPGPLDSLLLSPDRSERMQRRDR